LTVDAWRLIGDGGAEGFAFCPRVDAVGVLAMPIEIPTFDLLAAIGTGLGGAVAGV
jgi:hypothetical protein